MTRTLFLKFISFFLSYIVTLPTFQVYQENIYIPVEFQSFRKVLKDMGPDYDDLQMVSFNSTSKGFFGECVKVMAYVLPEQTW